MRPNTLHAILLVLACIILAGLKWLASSYTIHLPLAGNVSPVIAAVIVLPLVLVSVAAFNQRIIAWRKAHGKDIAEEQKHEFDDADIISLRPRQSYEHSSTYRRGDPDN
jgi:lipopolysaccharide export LptBFGC system permease protein LptF